MPLDHTNPERGKPASSLTSAIRVARIEEAERSRALGDLRSAEVARLELLRDALEPVMAEVPAEVDMFDMGVVPGEHPRLFVDMISYVEMGRDRRLYRFVQDTRHGRVLIAESEGLAAMIDAITRYVARRLVERQKALAALDLSEGTHRLDASSPGHAAAGNSAAAPAAAAQASSPRPSLGSRMLTGLRFCIDVLGVITLACLAWAGLQYWQGHGFPW